jgi:phosphoribosylformylglycinamidine synthase
VQRGNAEIQRRAQEVIDRCWALGEANPILSIHDVGAGGLSNALPELAHGAGRGARIDLRAAPNEEPGMTPREVWCNEAQERYVLAIAPVDLEASARSASASAARSRWSARPPTRRHLEVRDPLFGNNAGRHGPARAARQAAADDARRAAACAPRSRRSGSTREGIDLDEAVDRVLRSPAVADKTFLVTIGDRTVGGLCARDQMVGPWQVPVADCATTLLSSRGTRARRSRSASARRSRSSTRRPRADGRRRGAHQPGGGAGRVAVAREALGQLDGRGRLARRGRRALRHRPAVALDLCPALGVSIPVGKDSMSMRTPGEARARRARSSRPLSLIVSAFAPCDDVRGTWTPQLRTDRGRDRRWCWSIWRRAHAARRVDPGAGLRPDRRRGAGPRRPGAIRGLYAALAELRAARALVLAYHDRSDGGLFVTLCEMAFAGHTGLTSTSAAPAGTRPDRSPRSSPRSWARCCRCGRPTAPR